MKLKKLWTGIGRFFTFLTDRVYHAVAAGPLGRLFGGYERADLYFHRSAMVRLAHPPRRRYRKVTLRGRVAAMMDQSVLRRGAYALMGGFLRCSLRTVGAFFLTGGIYSALISLLVAVVWQEGVLNGFYLFIALGITLFGAMLLFSDRSVGDAIYRGRLTGALLHGSLGVSSDAMRDIPEKGKGLYAVSVPLGMLFGSITAFTGPVYPSLALLLLALTLIILSTPEAGILLSLIVAPFMGLLPQATLWIALLAVFSGFGYLGKLLRGTRAFRMEIQDFIVLLLLIGTLLTGVSAAGGSAARGAVLCAILILVYFPAVNILATPAWLQRCRWGLLFSATTTALAGIVQFVLALVGAVRGAGEFTMEMLGRAVRAGFSENFIFVYFMVLSFPFALHAFLRSRNAAHRTTAGLSCVAVLTAAVLAWVPRAWLALLVEILVLAVLCKKKSLPYIFFSLLLIPVLLLIIPDGQRAALFAFFASGEVTTGSALAAKAFFSGGDGFFSNGAGLLRLLFGFGAESLEHVSALYGVNGAIEIGFWWARLFEGGLLGVLLPALFFFFLLQNCFSCLPHVPKTQSTVAPASGIAMVAGVLLLGLFRDAWQDPTALWLFFLLCSITTADTRHRRALQGRTTSVMQNATFAQIEYRASRSHGKSQNADKEGVANESQ